jgi:hypothetical protein
MTKYALTILYAALLLSGCSRSNSKGSAGATPSPSRWLLLTAPNLVSETCENEEPCTGTPYVRAPLSDWKRDGEFNSFAECAASISSNDPAAASKDTDPDHKQGRLNKGERMLGFKCVLANDSRLLSPPPYDWDTESLKEP